MANRGLLFESDSHLVALAGIASADFFLAALGVFEPRCNRPRDPVAGAFPDPGRKPVTAGRRKLTNLLK